MTSLIRRLYSTEKCAKESGQEISSPQQRDGCNVFELLQEVEILPSFNEFQNFVAVNATIEGQTSNIVVGTRPTTTDNNFGLAQDQPAMPVNKQLTLDANNASTLPQAILIFQPSVVALRLELCPLHRRAQ